MQTMKRQPHWLNGRQMAASCGVSVQAFAAWNVPAVAKIGRECFYVTADVLTNRLARQADKTPPSQSDADSDLERALLMKAQREGQELKNAQLRRELAPIALIEWTLGKVANQIGATLDAIPLKVKKMVPRLTAVEVEHIKREVVRAQNAAARVTVELDEYCDHKC